MCKQFTSYLLPFLMNTNTSEAISSDWLAERTAGTRQLYGLISRQPASSNFYFDISTTYAGSCTLLCFSVMYSCPIKEQNFDRARVSSIQDLSDHVASLYQA